MNPFFQGPFDKQMTGFITGLPVNVQKPYPSAQIPTKNEQMANLLLSAFAGGGNAELSAVTQYMNHSQTIENKAVSNLLLYVALIEMYHMQILARMIVSLGGSLKYWNTDNAYWSGGNVEYGNSLCEKLSLDIFSEQEAVSGYEALLREINTTKAPGMEATAAVIQRLLEDEYYHLTLFKEAYTENGGVF